MISHQDVDDSSTRPLRRSRRQSLRQKTAAGIGMACACTLLAMQGLVFSAQAKPETKDTDATRKARLEFMKVQAAEYSVTTRSGKEDALTLHDDALLRFNNAVSGVPDGIVVMWKEGVRPAVVAQVFQVRDGAWIHEFQSLASSGLHCARGKTPIWTPSKPAAEFRKLEDAAAGEGSAAKRLLQMKTMAARFKATDDFKINPSDAEFTRNDLRLLPTPVYRYQSTDQEIIDGGMFALVHGTDPEVFLLLEYRSGPQRGWYYALVPMTCWAVRVTRDEKEIWSVPERFGTHQIVDPYFVTVYPSTSK